MKHFKPFIFIFITRIAIQKISKERENDVLKQLVISDSVHISHLLLSDERSRFLCAGLTGWWMVIYWCFILHRQEQQSTVWHRWAYSRFLVAAPANCRNKWEHGLLQQRCLNMTHVRWPPFPGSLLRGPPSLSYYILVFFSSQSLHYI